MTPEEKALVQAALELRYCVDMGTAGTATYGLSVAQRREGLVNRPADGLRIGRLLDAADALIYSCNECNTNTHTCPGDGNPIGHGDTACAEHGSSGSRTKSIASAPVEQVAPDEAVRKLVAGWNRAGALANDYIEIMSRSDPEWVAADMSFARPGDMLRLNGEEALVEKVHASDWNGDIREYTHRETGETRHYLEPRPHHEMRVKLAGMPNALTFERPGEVKLDILMSSERAAIFEMQKLGGIEHGTQQQCMNRFCKNCGPTLLDQEKDYEFSSNEKRPVTQEDIDRDRVGPRAEYAQHQRRAAAYRWGAGLEK